MHWELPVGSRVFQPRRRGGDKFRGFLEFQQALRILLIYDSLYHPFNDVHDGRGQNLAAATAVRMICPLHQFALDTTNRLSFVVHHFTSGMKISAANAEDWVRTEAPAQNPVEL
jgi:hypothetical protein